VESSATFTERLIRRPEQENKLARRRFQRGSVFINTAQTAWVGTFIEYHRDAAGREYLKHRKVSLCPIRREDGTPVGSREAERLLRPYVDRANANAVNPQRETKTIPFDAFAEVWKTKILITKKASTQASAKSVIKRLNAAFGQTEMRKITIEDLQSLVSKMHSDKMSPKTIRNVWGVVSRIWKAALTRGYVDAVLPKPEMPNRRKKPGRFFTLAEVALIISAGEPRVFYWLLAETGIRAGELAGLKLSDINGNRLNVVQSVWNGEEQTLKTENSMRSLVMSQQLQGMIWQQVASQKTKKHDFLFSAENGSPVDMNNFRQRKLKPLLEKLKIGQRGFHAFRHFNQSILDALGVPLKVREERAGHSLTGSITQNVYTHSLGDEGNEEAGRKLGAEIEEAVNSVTLFAPQQQEPPVEITEALENAA
jgi:integrase